MVAHRAYYGAAGCGQLPLLKKKTMVLILRSSEALLWAQSAAARGAAVLAIDGDDGTRLSRNEIAS